MDTDVTLKENETLEALNCEIEVPCPLQWGLLWFTENENEKFRKTVKHAIELSCNIFFNTTHTPRGLFVRTLTVLLCSAQDKDWDRKEEMQGWDVDNERIAVLIAKDEEAKRVPTDNCSHSSGHKAEQISD